MLVEHRRMSRIKDFSQGFGKEINTMTPMKNIVCSITLGTLMMLATVYSVSAVEVGQPAPDFELDSTAGGKLKLSSLRGKNVLINFYVLDYSPT
jgi:hypothetical protein